MYEFFAKKNLQPTIVNNALFICTKKIPLWKKFQKQSRKHDTLVAATPRRDNCVRNLLE